jgi:hypothetical protein
MNCAEALDRLDEQLDGALPEAAFQGLELHLAGCPACREAERRLRDLLAEAARLPRDIAPPRDLWPDIAERIARAGVLPFASRPRAAWRFGPVSLAAAAAVVLALLGPALWAPRPAPTPGAGRLADRRVAPAMPGLLPAATAPAALGGAESEYLRAADQLTAALAARRPALPPDAQRVVDENLRFIDGALDEIRAALREGPGSRELNRLLAATHKRKIDMLRRVARLAA